MSALPTKFVPKPWGKTDLPDEFINTGSDAIGEIWFEPPEALNALLVKYIFTTEALSVQCHPTDLQASSGGAGERGKEECWLVLEADPGAELMIGFNRSVTGDEMRRAATDGDIVDLLQRWPARAGDFFYIPANTVHAIGSGVILLEVQQNSDTTYRLYDYGRPRELHLDHGIAAAYGGPYPPSLHRQIGQTGALTLVDGPYFRLDRLDGPPDPEVRARYIGPLYALPLGKEAKVDGETIWPGQCAMVQSIDLLEVEGLCVIAQPV